MYFPASHNFIKYLCWVLLSMVYNDPTRAKRGCVPPLLFIDLFSCSAWPEVFSSKDIVYILEYFTVRCSFW
jgi:hypothetical protein